MGRPSTRHAVVAVATLENVSVPRCYHPAGFGKIVRREIHAFSDASKDAIGASIYLRLFNDRGDICTVLLFGQSKLTQQHDRVVYFCGCHDRGVIQKILVYKYKKPMRTYDTINKISGILENIFSSMSTI